MKKVFNIPFFLFDIEVTAAKLIISKRELNSKIIFIVLLFTFLKISTSITIARTADNKIISYITTCRVINNKLTEEKSVLIQINNRSGEGLTRISIPYNKNNNIDQLIGYICDINGKIIRKLNNKEITDVSSISDISLYEDNFVKKFELKHNTYPYRIFYKYSVTYKEFISIIDWFPIIDLQSQTDEAILNIEIPVDYKINVYTQNIKNAETDTVDDMVHYKWKASYYDLIHDEIYSPSFENIVPNVKVVPLFFNYDLAGSCETWESFGTWIYKLNSGLDVLPEFEKKRISLIIDTINNDTQKIKELYHYLQDNTRYVNVSIDIGGLKPFPASHVCQNKYGDCKALSIYMKSLLDFAGIESYYALIYGDERPVDIIQQMPGQQFNHAIIMVPTENDTIWLECTDNINPFGYVGTFIQNRFALIIKENGSQFSKTPKLTFKDVCEEKKVFFELSESGLCQVELTDILRGQNYEIFNYCLHNLSEQEKTEFVRKNIPFENFSLKKWELLRTDRDSPQIIFRSELLLPGYIKTYNNILVAEIIPCEIPLFENPENRKLPIRFDFPICFKDSIIYQYPRNFFPVIPDSIKINSKFGFYALNLESTDNQIHINRELYIFSGEYPISDYKELYFFIQKIKDLEKKNPMIFKIKSYETVLQDHNRIIIPDTF